MIHKSLWTCRLPMPLLHTNLFHPLCTGSALWIPSHEWNQVLALGHHSQALNMPSTHHATALAQAVLILSPRYAGRAKVRC